MKKETFCINFIFLKKIKYIRKVNKLTINVSRAEIKYF